MPPKMICPACGSYMQTRSLKLHYSLKPYRIRPDCNAKYTTDLKTKKRQIPILILSLTGLGFTIIAAFKGPAWVLLAAVCYIILWVYIGYTLSKITYVKYNDKS